MGRSLTGTTGLTLAGTPARCNLPTANSFGNAWPTALAGPTLNLGDDAAAASAPAALNAGQRGT